MAGSIVAKILPRKFGGRMRDVAFPAAESEDFQGLKVALEHRRADSQIQKPAAVVGSAKVMHVIPVLGLSYIDRLVHGVIPVKDVSAALHSISHGKHLVSTHVHDFEVHDIDVVEDSGSTPY
jgi:hypothetical protein